MQNTASKRAAFGLSLLCVIVALGVVGATHGLSAQRAVPAEQVVAVDGAYGLRLSSRKEEQVAREAAIASSVAKLDPEAAKYWQGVLEMMAAPQGRVTIATANGEIAIATGDRPALTSAATGTTRELGESSELSQKVESGALVQRVTSTTLGRDTLDTPLRITRNHALGRDGRTLTVETRIEGAVLTQAVVFTTSYERI